MRICYINRLGLDALKGKHAGGVEIQNANEALELAKDRRFDVHMIVEGSAETFTHKGITVHAFPNSIHRTYKLFREINAELYIERFVVRPQLIIDELLCRLLEKKFAYIEVGNPARALQRPFIVRLLYRVELKLANLLIANAQQIYENLHRFTKRKVYLINVPVFLTKSKAQREYILWTGRILPFKRVELFIELARKFPKEKFLIIALGEINQPLPKNVTVLHNVPHDQMDKYYAASKMLVHTSSIEGFGLVFLEAWRNKTPTVSMLNPDNVLTKYKTGLYSENFDELVRNVKLLLENKKKWKEFSENAYKYVAGNHDLKNIAEQYKSLFIALAKQQ